MMWALYEINHATRPAGFCDSDEEAVETYDHYESARLAAHYANAVARQYGYRQRYAALPAPMHMLPSDWLFDE